jgi:hypothetical protein
MFLPRTASSDDDSEGRTIWIADAHRDDGKQFVVRSEEKMTAFLELVSIRQNTRSQKALVVDSLGAAIASINVSGNGVARSWICHI